jgi:general nucleoside transport system permease protein
MKRTGRSLQNLILPVISLAFGLMVALVIAAILGESPLNVLSVMIEGAFGSPTQLGYSLYYSTPLLLTGLSVAWAFRAGLFNIGAEGQMALGGLAMAITGILLPGLPSAVAIPLALMAGFVVGGAWGAVAGWMKAKRGCHEVLATILLNFVAYGLMGFFILSVFKNPATQVPETLPVGSGYAIPSMAFLGGASPLNWSFVASLGLLAVYGFVFARTKFGFHQKMAGGAPAVGRRAGIDMDRQTIVAMFIAGGLAGLAAASPVLGFALKAREGFMANAGFVGIAVALLGRNSPVGIALSALLFGFLMKGALDLDLDTENVSRDLATVIQALIVLAVASHGGLLGLWTKLRRSHEGDSI